MTDSAANRSASAVRRRIMAGGIAAALLAPLIAMRFTREVDWTASDFLVAAMLLIGAAALYEAAASRTASRWRRRSAGAVLVLAVALIWAEGAVGLV